MEALDPKEQSSSESPERLQEAMDTEGQGEAAQESPVNPEEPTEETTPDITEQARAAEEELTEKIKEDDELSTKDSISELVKQLIESHF